MMPISRYLMALPVLTIVFSSPVQATLQIASLSEGGFGFEGGVDRTQDPSGLPFPVSRDTTVSRQFKDSAYAGSFNGRTSFADGAIYGSTYAENYNGKAYFLSSFANSYFSFHYINDGPLPIHAYLDFDISQIMLSTFNEGRSILPIFSSISSIKIFANIGSFPGPFEFKDNLYYAEAYDNGPQFKFSEAFNPMVVDAEGGLDCELAKQNICGGSVSGTLDLGLVDPGSVVNGNYGVSLRSFAPGTAKSKRPEDTVFASAVVPDVPGTHTTLRFVDPSASAVPEPTTWLSMILGLGIVGGALRRRSVPLLAIA